MTVLIEGGIALVYALWRAKPAARLVLAVVIANILTQIILWAALNLFPGQYQVTLLATEVVIWFIEGAILYLFPDSEMGAVEAFGLSLILNLASFAVGWFLPI